MVSERQLGEAKAYGEMLNILEERIKDLVILGKDYPLKREAIILTMEELSVFKEHIETLIFQKNCIDDKKFSSNDLPRSDTSGSVGSDNGTSGS